jgi:selenocysteine-specific elongation factor
VTVVVGTAGHIDHGKTSLLKALTGIDADRLPEERRRGMTIDVGYAHLRLPDGDELDFVDVPGHDRLVGNMLVGAGEVDAALLVVAADDGPMAQTLDHLELLDALGIALGIAAVTKIDAVEPSRVDEVVGQVRSLLERTRLAGSPVVPVSSLRGDGVADLLAALVDLRDRVRAGASPGGSRSTSARLAPARSGPARLAVDRVFVVRGRGIVVTGSLRGGRLDRGDTLRIEPGGRAVRAREIQVHGSAVESWAGGGRVALNLAGDVDAPPERGDVVTADPEVCSTRELLVVLHRPSMFAERPPAFEGRALRSANPALRSANPALRRLNPVPWPTAPGSVLRLHLGTAEAEARVGRARRELVDLPDGRRIVRLRLDRAIAAAAGDAFVLRRPSPAATAAGGRVLDPRPPVGPSRRRITPERLTALAVALGDGVQAAEAAEAARLEIHGVLQASADAAPGGFVGGDQALGGHRVARDVMAAIETEALAAVDDDAGAAGASLAELRPSLVRSIRRTVTVERGAATAIVDAVIDSLMASGKLARDGDRLLRSGAAAPGLDPEALAAMDRLVRSLAVPAPPSLREAARVAGCPPASIRALETAGRIIRLDDDLAYAASTFAELEATAIRLATTGPISPATFRDATGTSRKYVLPILEELDRRAILRRTVAGHVLGPKGQR